MLSCKCFSVHILTKPASIEFIIRIIIGDLKAQAIKIIKIAAQKLEHKYNCEIVNNVATE